MNHDFWVYIDGNRGDEWKAILGTNRVPVQTPIPCRAQLPGIGESDVYLLAIDALEPGQKEKIIAHLAKKFGLSPTETQHEVATAGIPILADYCSVVVHNPQRWFT